MKTTIEISDSLLDEAKRRAQKKERRLGHTESRVSGASSRNEKVAACFASARRRSRARDFSPGCKMQRGNESVKRFTREGADDRRRYQFARLRSSRGLAVARCGSNQQRAS